MNAAATALLDALRARGDAPFLVQDEGEGSAAAYLEAVEDARTRAADLPLDLRPGDVVAVRGRHPVLRLLAPLAAWSLDLCTLLLSDREPESSVDALLKASGARRLFGWRESGAFENVRLTPARAVRLSAGTLLATSGSSGRPKLVAHGLEQHVASAHGACAFLDLGPEDRLLLSLPTWHAGGLGIVLRAILSGAALCVPGAQTTLHDALLRHRPTHVSLVATQLVRLLQEEATTDVLRACRAVLVGGGPLPLRLRERALDAGVPIVVTYGATETSAFVAAGAARDVILRPQSAGRALPEREVRVDDEGQICVGGPTLFDGYLRDGQVHADRNDAGLWATGDVGRIEDGVLYVTGRRDRMFISGGENVQPEEIESALLAIDGVESAVVVPIEHAEFGARPVAFVAGRGLAARTLDAALRAVLPGYKTPDTFYAMPREAVAGMKPDIERLAALANDPGGLERL